MRAIAMLPQLVPRPAHVQSKPARDAAVAACSVYRPSRAACWVAAAVVGGVGLKQNRPTTGNVARHDGVNEAPSHNRTCLNAICLLSGLPKF
jgi:hypothetical protein